MDTTISINHNFIVYKHTNKINNKVYIGITQNTPNRRWINGHGYKRNAHFYSAIQEYGWDNFSHEILAKNLTAKEALLMEEKLIKEYNSTDKRYGYNHLISSIKKHPHFTEEDKKKIGESYHKYFESLSEEEKEKNRERQKLCHNTPQAKRNMSRGQKSRFQNETPEEKEIRKQKHKEGALKNIENIKRGLRAKLATLTEEDWKRRGEATKRGLSTPEAKQHLSEGHKKGLNTPEALERKAKKQKMYKQMMKEGKFLGRNSWNEFSSWYSKNKELL